MFLACIMVFIKRERKIKEIFRQDYEIRASYKACSYWNLCYLKAKPMETPPISSRSV